MVVYCQSHLYLFLLFGMGLSSLNKSFKLHFQHLLTLLYIFCLYNQGRTALLLLTLLLLLMLPLLLMLHALLLLLELADAVFKINPNYIEFLVLRHIRLLIRLANLPIAYQSMLFLTLLKAYHT